MKLKLLFALMLAATLAQAAPPVPDPVTIDSYSAVVRALDAYQAIPKMYRASYTHGTNADNITACTPWMWYARSNAASVYVTSAWSVVSYTTGIVDFAFSASALNVTGGMSGVYGIGLTDTTGAFRIYRQGTFTILASAFGSGVPAPTTSSNINMALYTWANSPFLPLAGGTMAGNVDGGGYTWSNFVIDATLSETDPIYLAATAAIWQAINAAGVGTNTPTLIAFNATNAGFQSQINGKMSTSTWASADSTTNYALRTTWASTNAGIQTQIDAIVVSGNTNGLSQVLAISPNAGGLNATNFGTVQAGTASVQTVKMGGQIPHYFSSPTGTGSVSGIDIGVFTNHASRWAFNINPTNALTVREDASQPGWYVGHESWYPQADSNLYQEFYIGFLGMNDTADNYLMMYSEVTNPAHGWLYVKRPLSIHNLGGSPRSGFQLDVQSNGLFRKELWVWNPSGSENSGALRLEHGGLVTNAAMTNVLGRISGVVVDSSDLALSNACIEFMNDGAADRGAINFVTWYGVPSTNAILGANGTFYVPHGAVNITGSNLTAAKMSAWDAGAVLAAAALPASVTSTVGWATNWALRTAWSAFTTAYASAASTTNTTPLTTWAAFTTAYATADATTNYALRTAWATFTSTYASADATTNYELRTGAKITNEWQSSRIASNLARIVVVETQKANQADFLGTNAGFRADIDSKLSATGIMPTLTIADRRYLSTNLCSLTAAYTGVLGGTIVYTGVVACVSNETYSIGFTRAAEGRGTATVNLVDFSLATALTNVTISNYWTASSSTSTLRLTLSAVASEVPIVSALYVYKITNGSLYVADRIRAGTSMDAPNIAAIKATADAALPASGATPWTNSVSLGIGPNGGNWYFSYITTGTNTWPYAWGTHRSGATVLRWSTFQYAPSGNKDEWAFGSAVDAPSFTDGTNALDVAAGTWNGRTPLYVYGETNPPAGYSIPAWNLGAGTNGSANSAWAGTNITITGDGKINAAGGVAVAPFDAGPTNDATADYTIKATIVAGATNWYYAADDDSAGSDLSGLSNDVLGAWATGSNGLITAQQAQVLGTQAQANALGAYALATSSWAQAVSGGALATSSWNQAVVAGSLGTNASAGVVSVGLVATNAGAGVVSVGLVATNAGAGVVSVGLVATNAGAGVTAVGLVATNALPKAGGTLTGPVTGTTVMAASYVFTNGMPMNYGKLGGTNGVYWTLNSTNYWISFGTTD